MNELNETQLAQFRAQLDAQQAQVRSLIDTIFQTSSHASHHLAAKKLSRLTTDDLIEFAVKIENPNLKENIEILKKIDASLVSIELGMYGFCSDCEGELIISDLEKVPTTQRCRSCETKYQKQRNNNYRL
ncbi:MAG: molecular chaperone DnaK [Psychromonas sp.]|nr:molecular chaperone DnaK [Psychromonas sp.]